MDTALRFRTDAATRERLAATAHDRLSWFEAVGCSVPPGDRSIVTAPGPGGEETWTLVREASSARLYGGVSGAALGVPLRLAVETRQACE